MIDQHQVQAEGQFYWIHHKISLSKYLLLKIYHNQLLLQKENRSSDCWQVSKFLFTNLTKSSIFSFYKVDTPRTFKATIEISRCPLCARSFLCWWFMLVVDWCWVFGLVCSVYWVFSLFGPVCLGFSLFGCLFGWSFGYSLVFCRVDDSCKWRIGVGCSICLVQFV